MAKQLQGGTAALRQLSRAGVEFTAHEFGHDGAEHGYGLAAATALGVDPARVFKTLVAMADGRPVVAVVPVDRQLSLKRLAATVAAKRAEIAAPADAERITGYVVGGISAFGQKRTLPTVLDASASAFETIFVSGGRRGLDVEVAPGTLVAVLDAKVADIAA